MDDERDEIIRNAIRCLRCNTVIESEHSHDYRGCPCGAVAVDGGRLYLRRIGRSEDFEELAVVMRG